MNKYTNPIIFADYSDPDVIRVDDDFFMVASSFNYTPAVPVLHSKNLVEWELVNYVAERLPFERFDRVCAGCGAWAPSLRYHDGVYYCIVPFPDEGVYVSETDNPFGSWSPLRPLICGKGIIDPCPIWADDKCYLAVAFAKSRVGFNSCIGLYEVDEKLTRCLSDGYRIIYDGHDNNPTIEGPKFYRHGDYFYILAPAGSVKSGWQTALRSKNIYGPYESKIVLMQNDSQVNGPHQGALVDLADGKYAFLHFQDLGAYGRVVHLQPAVWQNDWPICGEMRDAALAGTPVAGGDYPVDIKTDYRLKESDLFDGERLSLMWQTPANKGKGLYELNDGLRLNCVKNSGTLSEVPNLFTAKITRKNCRISTKVECDFVCDGDEAGLAILGESYACMRIYKRGDSNVLAISENDRDVFEKIFDGNEGRFTITLKANGDKIDCAFYFNGKRLPYKFLAVAGKWVGAKIALYARGKDSQANNSGFATFKYYKVF